MEFLLIFSFNLHLLSIYYVSAPDSWTVTIEGFSLEEEVTHVNKQTEWDQLMEEPTICKDKVERICNNYITDNGF